MESIAETFNQTMQRVINEVSLTAPVRGALVKVYDGKHKGKMGEVFWHGVDKFSHAGRYGDAVTDWIRIAGGRYGFNVGIREINGDRFFTKADYCIVSVTKEAL